MIGRRLTLAVLLVVASPSGCARKDPPPVPQQFEFGARRVQLIVPTGWEALDQGKQKRFRKGEFSIVLQYLGPATPSSRDAGALIDWGLAAIGADVGHDQQREVKSRRTFTIDGRDATEIETWNRLDHANPQRMLFVSDHGDLLALHIERMAFEETLAAFDAIRDSLHLVRTQR
jgi:hypothetical protein